MWPVKAEVEKCEHGEMEGKACGVQLSLETSTGMLMEFEGENNFEVLLIPRLECGEEGTQFSQ